VVSFGIRSKKQKLRHNGNNNDKGFEYPHTRASVGIYMNHSPAERQVCCTEDSSLAAQTGL
jgi:hypothetical protein